MQNPQLIEFTTEDGLMLPGLLYEAKDSKKAAIYLHGNGSSSVFYDEGDSRDLPENLIKKNISFLKFNNRGAHLIKKFNIEVKGKEERVSYGTSFEIIKECVYDIEAAVSFLKKQGYKEFYLIGTSTGANKICVYNHYKSKNEISKYVLVAGGDDTAIYYSILGDKNFWKLLKICQEKIKEGKGQKIIPDLLEYDLIFSYQGFFDIANPDGDYNCFPFAQSSGKMKISEKPLFKYFSEIKKPSLVIYGELDEYCLEDKEKLINILKNYQPDFDYKIIKGADHRFTGKRKDLAEEISTWLLK